MQREVATSNMRYLVTRKSFSRLRVFDVATSHHIICLVDYTT